MRVNLPKDILRLIFECAAYENRIEVVHTLLFVSKDVNRWVEKIAYAIVSTATHHRVECFSRTLSARPELAPLVRALAVPQEPLLWSWDVSVAPRPVRVLCEILEKCTSLKALYWNMISNCTLDDFPGLRSILASLPLKILYLRLGGRLLAPLDFNDGVTHLGILDASLVLFPLLHGPEKCAIAPERCNGLTHLALRVDCNTQVILPAVFEYASVYGNVLRKLEKLKTCVLHLPDLAADPDSEESEKLRRWLSALAEVEDERVVAMERDTGLDEWWKVVEEWDRSDLAVAEGMIEKRRMKKVQEYKVY